MTISRRVRQALRHGEVLVDAHNLCFRDAALGVRMREDPERARQALERRLGRRPRTVLFYDGGPQGERRLVTRLGLRCVYSGTGSGDDEIVAWLRGRRSGGAVVVVSDDRQLRDRCRAGGALCCHCRDYLAWLDDDREEAPEERTHQVPDPDEVDYWVRRFEDG